MIMNVHTHVYVACVQYMHVCMVYTYMYDSGCVCMQSMHMCGMCIYGGCVVYACLCGICARYMHMWYIRVWLVFAHGSCTYMHVIRVQYMHVCIYFHWLQENIQCPTLCLVPFETESLTECAARPEAASKPRKSFPLSTPHSLGLTCL